MIYHRKYYYFNYYTCEGYHLLNLFCKKLYYYLYNEVDGFTFIRLKDEDLVAMFPGKVGQSRRVSCLIAQLQGAQGITVSLLCNFIQYDTTAN